MATQNDMISISPELGIMNPLTDKFFPNQEWVQPIMEENFKWMFYSMMKLSSQLELKTNKFGRISCTEVCTEIDKNYKRYYLEIEISNLGFSEAKNFDIKILETAPFYIATIDGQNKSALIGETNTLKISSLKSLESKVYKMEARIKNSESDIINTETSKSPKPYVEFSFLKYPYLSSYHATSHRIDMVQVTTSDPISIPAQEASNLIIYVFIMIGILIIIAGICLAILIIGKLNRKKTIDTEKVELKQENPKGKRKLQIANLSEDDTEDIGI